MTLPTSDSRSVPESVPGAAERWLGGLAVGAILVAFAPLAAWVARTTIEREQFHTAALLVAFAGLAPLVHARDRLRFRGELGTGSATLLVGGALGLAAGGFAPALAPFAVPAAAAAVVAAAVRWCFGSVGRDSARALAGGVAGSIFLLQAQPWMDWPLRTLAGQGAGGLLALLGHEANLALARDGAGWALLLVVDGRPFHVAAECNGFGILSGSILLAFGLALGFRSGVREALAAVASAALLGFLGNLLRIVVIILLAPLVGDHYLLMHEIAGTAVLVGVLALVAARGWPRATSA